jgi:hypothetical protein
MRVASTRRDARRYTASTRARMLSESAGPDEGDIMPCDQSWTLIGRTSIQPRRAEGILAAMRIASIR